MRNFQQQRSDAYNNMFLQGHQTAIGDIINQYELPINAAAAWRSGGQIAPYQPKLIRHKLAFSRLIIPVLLSRIIRISSMLTPRQWGACLDSAAIF
jgi:hypothetical protein